MTILAVDQSTTSTSAFLFASDGGMQKLMALPHRQHHPQPGRVEHDPMEILRHITTCIEAGQRHGALAFALSNQGESCLAWDRQTGDPISPIIVWQDNRTKTWCKALAADHANSVARIARLPITPYFSASKLGWIVKHIPRAATLAKAGRLALGTSDAFFRDRMTGRFETDVATASRTSLINMETGQWDRELCQIFGVPIDCLPEIGACSGDLGAAQGLPLAAAIVDQQAALFGHGVTTVGQTKFTFGTGAFAQTLVGRQCPPMAHGVVPTVAWKEAGQETYFALDGGIHTASSAVEWARGLGLFQDYSALASFSGHALQRGLAFVPALAGLACPHWDNSARGMWLGLALDTTKADMMQAVLEGIAYRAREVCDAMQQIIPADGPIRIDGGMTQNAWFCQLLSNVIGREVEVAQMAEITAYGAALMAANHLDLSLPLSTTRNRFKPDAAFTADLHRFEQARILAKNWSSASP